MGIKSIIANRELATKLLSVKRERKICNLDSAMSAGILWEYGQKESFDKINKELKNHGIITSGLCYFPEKKAIVPQNINGFTRKQNTWADIPKAEVATDFIRHKFDILIDLTGQKYFPVVYLTALSVATFKVGYSESLVNYFDFTIEFSEIPEPGNLAEEILYFLKKINKTTIE